MLFFIPRYIVKPLQDDISLEIIYKWLRNAVFKLLRRSLGLRKKIMWQTLLCACSCKLHRTQKLKSKIQLSLYRYTVHTDIPFISFFFYFFFCFLYPTRIGKKKKKKKKKIIFAIFYIPSYAQIQVKLSHSDPLKMYTLELYCRTFWDPNNKKTII